MGHKSFDMELFFAALADRTRLRLINLMGADELCVCFFVEVHVWARASEDRRGRNGYSARSSPTL